MLKGSIAAKVHWNPEISYLLLVLWELIVRFDQLGTAKPDKPKANYTQPHPYGSSKFGGSGGNQLQQQLQSQLHSVIDTTSTKEIQ